jgi:hypothetical protein
LLDVIVTQTVTLVFPRNFRGFIAKHTQKLDAHILESFRTRPTPDNNNLLQQQL